MPDLAESTVELPEADGDDAVKQVSNRLKQWMEPRRLHEVELREFLKGAH